ncbi:MAG TPA: DUF423 domain-containing protein [Pirellulaceae bacterium]|nr:DUF423 domain-containing protein [Pirellulaceae bacterium]
MTQDHSARIYPDQAKHAREYASTYVACDFNSATKFEEPIVMGRINSKWMLVFAAAIVGTGVLLGAIGSHALRGYLFTRLSTSSADAQDVRDEVELRLSQWEKGVQYQIYHGLAILGIACVNLFARHALLSLGSNLFVVGVVLFSGTLYFIALFDSSPVVMLAPIGGICFMLGWVCCLIAFLRIETHTNPNS